MPWKGEKDPYKIWLSEIILQQTRVEQGLGYYNRFVQTYPAVQQLAAAPEKQVFKLWEGLGYYSRCKNLIAAAKHITYTLNGRFPNTYEAILALKGVGPYTAAAIASFAFGLPHAVVDGNVFRVLARFFGIDTPIDSVAGKKYFSELASQLLDKQNPGTYNQAIMDFGATVCTPRAPACRQCPLHNKCIAFATGSVQQLPVKEKTTVKKNRWLYYVVAQYNGRYFVRKRKAGDIWENLYEFIPIEASAPLQPEEVLNSQAVTQLIGQHSFKNCVASALYRQVLTHQIVQGCFIQVVLKRQPALKEYEAVSARTLSRLPFPKFINHWLKDKNVSLNLL